MTLDEAKKIIKSECYIADLLNLERTQMVNTALDTVIEAAEETRWIPCSEKLPKICEKDCFGDITFSKTVLTTQIYGNGYVNVGVDVYTTNNGGGWLSEVPFDNPNECCKVIAWMPLPHPYKAEGSDEE